MLRSFDDREGCGLMKFAARDLDFRATTSWLWALGFNFHRVGFLTCELQWKSALLTSWECWGTQLTTPRTLKCYTIWCDIHVTAVNSLILGSSEEVGVMQSLCLIRPGFEFFLHQLIAAYSWLSNKTPAYHQFPVDLNSSTCFIQIFLEKPGILEGHWALKSYWWNSNPTSITY